MYTRVRSTMCTICTRVYVGGFWLMATGLFVRPSQSQLQLQFISIVIIVIDIEIYFLFAWKDANSIGIMQWVCNEVYSLSIDQ